MNQAVQYTTETLYIIVQDVEICLTEQNLNVL